MSIELRPLGVACNLACHYCYQNPQRDAGNQRTRYDLEKMKAAAARLGGPFTLFGGEPLLMPLDDLEELFAWGLATSGYSSIQTNGVLIDDRHIELFRRYKVHVGISLDGPGALNDMRWTRTLDRTRESTARVEEAIRRLCSEYEPPGLIVTLHKGNATAERLPIMSAWFRELDAIGITSVRLHLLEVDDRAVRDRLALSARENIDALLAFAGLELKRIRFDLFQEMEQLLLAQDSRASCTWRACDPYTTQAVQGIEGSGQSSNCGRTNKDGVDFIKADAPGYERYLALYATPQSEHGCEGCRFFLMCKGQCPGTAVDGDWRNRTEHCEEWKQLFMTIERRLIVSGQVPLTIQPIRLEVERRQLAAWREGRNPSISRTLSVLQHERRGVKPPPSDSDAGAPLAAGAGSRDIPRPRVSWVGDRARELWEDRLSRLQSMLEDLTAYAARADGRRCAVRRIPNDRVARHLSLAAQLGVAAVVLPGDALPDAFCTRPGHASSISLAGDPSAIAAAEAAWASGDHATFSAWLDLPSCCLASRTTDQPHDSVEQRLWASVPEHMITQGPGGSTAQLSETISTHPLLAHLGLSVLPVLPCSLDCRQALDAAERLLCIAAANGFATEVGWLRECLAWATSWSEHHGITEIKTPVFKMCLSSGSNPRGASATSRRIVRAGMLDVTCGASGLNFPYAQPVRRTRERLIPVNQ
jgi:uncharacterized protein